MLQFVRTFVCTDFKVQTMNKMLGVVQHINLQNNLFSVRLEDGTYSICYMREPIEIEIGAILFGGFKFYGMNYLETETIGEQILVDVLRVFVSEDTAKHAVLHIGKKA